MKPQEINKLFFSKGTTGYSIMKKFFLKYHDLFSKSEGLGFNDFLNQIFLNINSIKLSDDISNPEAYIVGAIKIQCRVQLDKAIKTKNIYNTKPNSQADEEQEDFLQGFPTNEPGPEELFELQEMFNVISYFKLSLSTQEVRLLNFLIDGSSRMEIVEKTSSNLNTLDTNIRRLRIKLMEYLQDKGYSSETFKRIKK